eukprot:TRINITY_DN394_c1_g1_i1.p1 TRINITY_DN394_c1_g1~~TRINITY_DN394_c1_g1_i1.p1  ORF type:complete len:297 (-),score=51.55 TRINITY_DN394_c1_g1_i1:681-1571(-)
MGEVIDANYLGITAIVTVVYQFCFFCVAAGCRIDKVTDFAGGTNFVVLAVLTAILKGEWAVRQVVLTLFVVVWGLRLAIFLLLRILQWGEDKRFDESRNSVLQTAGFWFFQALWVWIVSLPVTFVNAKTLTNAPAIGAADVIGWTMWAVGLAVEATADQQKLAFKGSPASRGHWCDVGVWKWSRHPNYFGEILLWWGVFVAASPVLSGWQWTAVASPLFTSTILLFLSGIPLLEASADKKYGEMEEYKSYKLRTSPLIPLPPVLFGALPVAVKTLFFFEWPLYNKILDSPPGEKID